MVGNITENSLANLLFKAGLDNLNQLLKVKFNSVSKHFLRSLNTNGSQKIEVFQYFSDNFVFRIHQRGHVVVRNFIYLVK